MKKIIFLFSFLFFVAASFSQDVYNIAMVNGDTITGCEGTFTDSGGEGGSYSANESYTVTFCSDDPDSTHILLAFTSYQVDASDQFIVHDGPTVAAPVIPIEPFNQWAVYAGLMNSSGCLTVQFISNGTAQGTGWVAGIHCQYVCQQVVAGYSATGTSPNVINNYIDVCGDEPITFYGNATFPQNQTVYQQSIASSTFVWNFGDGTSATGQVVNHTYAIPRGYDVTLQVTDVHGCTSTNSIGLRVRISHSPINGGNPLPTICAGTPINLEVGYNPNATVIVDTLSHYQTATIGFDSTMFIPDGPICPELCYWTDAFFNVFNPGQTITASSNILSICVNMEHSFVGDLEFTIFCPNGQWSRLKKFINSGGAWLGVPIDNGASDNGCLPQNNLIGTGWDYCWSEIYPNNGTINANSSLAQVPATNIATETGYYLPENIPAESLDGFSDLIGCPLNGTWSIRICDNWGSDNGWIFNWTLNLDPNLLPANWGYTILVDSVDWVGPYITSHTPLVATVVPQAGGTYNYDAHIVDNFGCIWDTTVTLNVYPTYIVNFPADTVLCSDATLMLDASNNGANIGALYVWHNSYDNTSSTNSWWLADKPGMYWVDIPNIVNQCGHTDSIQITYNDMGLELGNNINNVCITNPVTLDASATLSGYPSVSYLWSTGATTNSIIAYTSGIYTVSVARGNCIEKDTIVVNYQTPLSVNLGPDKQICPGQQTTINAGSYLGATYHWSSGANTQNLVASIPGAYIVTVTNACGTSKDTIMVNQILPPTVSLGPDQIICIGSPLLLTPSTNNQGTLSYAWITGSTAGAIVVNQSGNYVVTVTNQCGSASDMIQITGQTPLNLNLGTDTTICQGQSLILNANAPGADVMWSNGAQTQAIQVTIGDLYEVVAENTCGTYSDWVVVNVSSVQVNLGQDTIICPGQTFVLNAGYAGSTYQWNTGSYSQSYSVTVPGIYAVTVTNAYGCKGNDQILITLFSNSLDLGPDTAICSGDVLVLNTGYPNSPTAWTNGITGPENSITTAGIYGVSINHYCGSLSDEIVVSVNPVPAINLGNDVDIAVGQTVTLDAGTGFASYLWSTGEFSQTIVIGDPGDYWVEVSNEYGCKTIDTIKVKLKSGFSNLTETHGIQIYPNPARNQVTIQTADLKMVKVELYNVLGEMMLTKSLNSNSCQLDVSSVAEGVYMVRLTGRDGNTHVRSFTVNR